MNTADLIQILAKTNLPKRPIRPLVIFIGWFLVTAIFTAGILKLRPDVDAAMFEAGMWGKALFLAAIAACALSEFRRLFSVLPKKVSLLQKIFYGGVASFALGALAYTLIFDPMAQIYRPFTLINFPECLFFVTTYGLIGVMVLIPYVRHFAPGNINHASQAFGFVCASVSAVGYSIHCPIDNPVFIIAAYGSAIIMTTCLSRLIAPTFIKW